MLIQFTVENFLSFRDEIKFSMAATSLTELPENIFPLNDETKLFRTAVIYGPNAAGKSNLIYALVTLRRLIVSGTREAATGRLPEIYFKLDKESSKRPTRFTVDFVDEKNVPYKYHLSFTPKYVVEESLHSYPLGRPRLIFERKANPENETYLQEVKFGEAFFSEEKGEEIFLKSLKPHALLLSVAAFLNIDAVAPVFKWFNNKLRPFMGAIDEEDRQLMAELLNNDNDLLKWVKDMVNSVDLGIHDLEILELKKREEVNVSEQRKKSEYDLRTIHGIYNQNGEIIDKTWIPWGLESRGTELFLILLPKIYRALKGSGVLILDELGAQLHPFLVLKLLQLFNNSATNPKNAQLIFSTHITTLLDNELLRRDQIWFVEKKKGETSALYSLAEFSPTPRKGEALEKGYLRGRYGALPFVGELKI